MLLLGQYGIVGLEFVFFEELLSTSNLEVEEGIPQTKNCVGHRREVGEE